MEENNLKCPNCGASILPDEKKCSYCGSANKFYVKAKESTEKNLKPELKEDDFDNLGDLFGGFLGGVMLGKAVKDLKRTFFPHDKRD